MRAPGKQHGDQSCLASMITLRHANTEKRPCGDMGKADTASQGKAPLGEGTLSETWKKCEDYLVLKIVGSKSICKGND